MTVPFTLLLLLGTAASTASFVFEPTRRVTSSHTELKGKRKGRCSIALEMTSENDSDHHPRQITTPSSSSSLSRRAVFSRFSILVSTAALNTPYLPASATIMDTTQEQVRTFQPGQSLSVSEAKDRFRNARKDVSYLLDNYSTISANGNGDAVRRYLGTVGVTSNMYGITKVLKDLRSEADDIVEYTEAFDEFSAYLYQAEGAAYQSLFVEHSSAKGTPESLLKTARQDVVQMERYMDVLAGQLGL